MWDVVIAGAGPAGSIAAIVLARAGARVMLLDRARFPRHKLCGDTLNPGTLAILRRLCVESSFASSLPVAGMIVTGEGGVRVEGRYPDGVTGRALLRRDFDAALVKVAADAGARVEEGVLVQEALAADGRVRGLTVKGRDGRALRLMAPIVIAADGRESRIARSLGLARHPPRPRRWAVGAYFDGVPRANGTAAFGEMHVRAGRYIGVAPLPGGLTNACVVTADRAALRHPTALLLSSLQHEAALGERFAGARLIDAPVVLGPLALECHTPGAAGLLLAGDAAGFIDPMTGDGLRFALRGAELAALEALRALDHGDDGAAGRLRAARRREFAAKWRFNRALRHLSGSPAAVHVAGLASAAAPPLLRHVIGYAGDVRSA
jgi:flavin-dependent dehydrogenase